MKMDRRLWPVLMAYVTAAVFALGSVQYATYVDAQSNARWCQLLTVLDGAYAMTPPKTQTGKLVASEIHKLFLEFDC